MTKARRTAQEMYPLIEAYLDRTQTQKDFCREHGISVSMLCYWLAKYRQETDEKPSSFLEITPSSSPADQALLEIVYPHGVRLRLFSPVAPGFLQELLTLEGRTA